MQAIDFLRKGSYAPGIEYTINICHYIKDKKKYEYQISLFVFNMIFCHLKM